MGLGSSPVGYASIAALPCRALEGLGLIDGKRQQAVGDRYVQLTRLAREAAAATQISTAAISEEDGADPDTAGGADGKTTTTARNQTASPARWW